MRFIFNERKAAQAAAYLIKLHGGTLNYMALIKLLYLADRESLVKTGLPITGDRMFSMTHGTALSIILNLINMGKFWEPTPWYDYISEPKDYNVSLVKIEDEFDELSRYEIKVLKEINDKHGHLDKWALRDLTHTLPEWEDPHGSSKEIDPTTILRLANKSQNEIERISADAEELYFLSALASQKANADR